MQAEIMWSDYKFKKLPPERFTLKLNQLIDVFCEMTRQFKQGIRIDQDEYSQVQKQIEVECQEIRQTLIGKK